MYNPNFSPTNPLPTNLPPARRESAHAAEVLCGGAHCGDVEDVGQIGALREAGWEHPLQVVNWCDTYDINIYIYIVLETN